MSVLMFSPLAYPRWIQGERYLKDLVPSTWNEILKNWGLWTLQEEEEHEGDDDDDDDDGSCNKNSSLPWIGG